MLKNKKKKNGIKSSIKYFCSQKQKNTHNLKNFVYEHDNSNCPIAQKKYLLR